MSDRHEPWCDSQLGPDFRVEPGAVHMTISLCFGCKGEEPPPAGDPTETAAAGMEASDG